MLVRKAMRLWPAVRFSPLMIMMASLHQEYGNGNPKRSHHPGLHQFAMLSTVKTKAMSQNPRFQ